MLRIIVISLVVANLLLLGFQSSTPDVQPEARPAPAVTRGANIPTIHLFSEMMQDQGLMSGNRQCFTLGPFHSVADWDDVHARLQKVSTRVSERQTEALVEKGYWVYLPPYPSLLEANKALLSLQALGLKDVAIMYDGEWKNSISLGYFMRQSNAQGRKKGLESKGFEPLMRIQRQAEPRYWLDYEQEPGSGLVSLDMQNRPNDFMQRPVPCPEAEFPEMDAAASQETVEDQHQPGDGAQTANVEPGAGQNAGATTEPPLLANDGSETGVETETPPQTGDESGGQPDGDGEDAAAPSEAPPGDKVADAPVASETVKSDAGAEIPTTDDSEKTSGSGDQPAAVVDSGQSNETAFEPAARLAVGTGPSHFVSTEPEPKDTGVTDRVEAPTAGAAENKPEDGGGEKTADDSAANPPAAPPADKEKDGGNGNADG